MRTAAPPLIKTKHSPVFTHHGVMTSWPWQADQEIHKHAVCLVDTVQLTGMPEGDLHD